MLILPEEFFLLSIDDNKGKIIAEVSDGLELGLAGALLAVLYFTPCQAGALC